MKPRILIFSTAYYPYVGGAEVAVKELTDRLTDYDFELITARLDRKLPTEEQIGRVLVHRIGWGIRIDKFWLAWQGGRIAQRIHQQKNYQGIWAIMASFGGFAAADLKSRAPELPYLLTLQEGDDLAQIEYKVRRVKARFQAIFLRADFVQCISNYLAQWAKKLGVGCPIEVVPNGVDLDNVELRMACLRRQANDELKKNTEEKILITTSRLVRKNGLDDLIKSLKYLPDYVVLEILGVGPEEQNLKQLAAKLGLKERVKFMGFIPNPELFSYLEEADIFIRPSLSEGLGNSFIEAMAAGLPTVGTPVGGIVDFLKDGQTGWLANVRDPESIAEKVKFIIDPANQKLVAEVAQAGAKLVKANYSWDAVTNQMKKILASVFPSP